MEWSEAKKEVFAFESDIVVSAGAGSGKTAALVELYLRLLGGETSFGPPLEVEEIVAITFTDKAALEMKERVRAGVLARLADANDRGFWEIRRRAMQRAVISTFHAFCSRILRENPAEAKVDPSFSLLDEQAAGAELQEALDEVIEKELGDKSEDIRVLLRQFPLTGRGHGKGLREHLAALHWQLSGSAAGEADLESLSQEWQEKARRLFMEGRETLKGLMAEVSRILHGKPLQFHERLTALPGLYAGAALLPGSGETLDEIAAMQSCIAGGWGKEKTVRDALSRCLETMELCCRQILAAPVASALVRLSARVETTYRMRKDARGFLDFDDLQRKTRDLLERDPEIRGDCLNRFRVVMVDEYQDTNPLQKELIRLLAGPGQRLFIVGDPKQSIYLFRGADVSVFSQSQREIAEKGGRNLYFQESFRSRQGIIDFVNAFFSRIMRGGESDFEVGYREEDHLLPQRLDWDGAPCVEFMGCDDSCCAGERGWIEAAAIAARIARLVSGRDGAMVYDRVQGNGGSGLAPSPRIPGLGDIAILFRRFSNLKVYEHELRRSGIPYYVVKGRGFYRCQEVLDILNFLSWLEFGGDLAALAGLLRSPLCGISDETLYLLAKLEGGIAGWEKLFGPSPLTIHSSHIRDRIDPADRDRLESLFRLVSRLRPLRDRLTMAELLEEVLTGTDFASTLLTTFQGGQKVANLRKLIEMSRTFSEGEGGSLRRFVNYLADLVDKEPTEAEALTSAEGEDVVRLMTIHQSKGLEFPVVFIPELGMMHPGSSSPVLWDGSMGIGVRTSLPGSPGRPTLAWQEISALLRRKEGAELQRLLYVAMTRARDYLILSGEGKGEWRRWLGDFLDEEGGRLVRRIGADSILEESAPFPVAVEEHRAIPEPAVISAAIRRAIQATPPPPSEMVFSPTALEDYRTCPRKYFYKAVLGLDEGLFAELLVPAYHGQSRGAGENGAGGGRGGKRERKGLSAIDRGNLAHLLLERMDFSASRDSRRAECERLAPLLAPSPDEAGVAEVTESVMAFAESPLAGELGTMKLHREYPFILKLKGKADFLIRGTMDLVAVTDDRAMVYDYKYLSRENADLDGYRFQVSTYMLVLTKAFPEKVVSGQLLFLRGGEAETVTCDVERFESELLEIMEGIRERSSETEFDLRKGCDGSHCPFRQRCQT